MEMKSTVTFGRTAHVYYNRLNKNEYASRLRKHLEEGLPGKPSYYRYRQIVSMGGSRSSKSYSILQMLLLELMRRKNIKITVWRKTKVECRTTVMEDFQKIIMFDPNVFRGFKVNRQAGSFTYEKTNSKIVFEGADSVGKVLGGTQTISFFNEVTEFSKDVYLQITQRTADRVICDYNPSKDFWLEKYRFDEDSVFIHSDFRNNEYCPPNIVKQLLSYEPWVPGSYEVVGTEIYYKGKPADEVNQPPKHEANHKKGTADEYMWLVYGLGLGAEKPQRIHRGWEKISNDFFKSLDYESYFGLDFGTSNPTACMEVKYDGDQSFYIRKAFHKPLQDMTNSLPHVFKTKIKNYEKGESLIVGDSAKQAFIDALGDLGHMIMPAKKGAGSVEYGIGIIQKFKIYYVPDPDLDNEYQNYSWGVDRYGKATEVPIKMDDHLMDALRYIITYLVEWLQIRT